MPYIEITRWVQGEPEKVYQLASQMEQYPAFMKDVRSIQILERGEGYTITEWVTEVDGRVIRWQERDEFFPHEGLIRYHQLSGDLKKFEGYWKVEEKEEGGLKGSQITLVIDFDLGIPMLSALLHPVLKQKVKANSESMVEAIKKQIEQKERTLG
ncbi:type II toxin-antitoxin system RatA family toxin [Heliorestis convoluta]|uniref:Polyketide cyclase / dehydrase and lipid transport family protein n=1 Tax=Heliorestis convoluta TaxID=356322 RepID=A0A5Q2MY23_9FIRM|nr:aromatase/cyclase [Heliorestis convoluta]QGG47754.1 polyketide cyclase / dehydrase and lipid transport family protein [Heliorestis convoluta]